MNTLFGWLVICLLNFPSPPVVSHPVKARPRTLGDDVEWTLHNYTEMGNFLADLTKQFPKIAKLHSIGDSVEGRKMLALEISDEPGKHEPGEPEFKYIANMHGNEIVGKELLLRLAEELCQNYGTDEKLTRMVDTTRIFLMPSMNPDGYELAAKDDNRKNWVIGRSNANNVDLNRNFPDQFFKSVNGPPQPETQAMMKWISSRPFVLSANLHGGSLVANYPYDDSPTGKSIYSKAPDDDVFKALAKSYSENHPTMHMKNPPWPCPEVPADHFDDGITNGAKWYSVSGGMQDFNYVHSNCFELTIEQGCKKFPDVAEMPTFWEENKHSLLAYMDMVHQGVKGFVKDVNGAPIKNATISVQGRKKEITTAQDGDYWRLLLPGDYQLSASAPGYETVTKRANVVNGTNTTELNFTLKKGGNDMLNDEAKPNPQEDSKPEDGSAEADEEGTGGMQPVTPNLSPQQAMGLMQQMGVPLPGITMNPMGGGGGGGMGGGGMGGGMGGMGGQMGGMGGQMGGDMGDGGMGMGAMGMGGMGMGMGGGMNMDGMQMGDMMQGMNSEEKPSHGGHKENLEGDLMGKVEGFGGSDLEVGGNLGDNDLDQVAMMSPYENQAKDSSNNVFRISTDENQQGYTAENPSSQASVVRKSTLARPRK